MYLLLTDDE